MNTQLANEVLSDIVIDKSSVAVIANTIIEALQEGTVRPIDVALKFKAMEKIIKNVKATLDPLARSEAELEGIKSFTRYGSKIELAEVGTEYDYSICGDSVLDNIIQEEMMLKERKKERENFLKSIKGSLTYADEVTGEMITIRPPLKTSTSSIKITL